MRVLRGTCSHCDAVFDAGSVLASYCGGRCRTAAYRARQRDELQCLRAEVERLRSLI